MTCSFILKTELNILRLTKFCKNYDYLIWSCQLQTPYNTLRDQNSTFSVLASRKTLYIPVRAVYGRTRIITKRLLHWHRYLSSSSKTKIVYINVLLTYERKHKRHIIILWKISLHHAGFFLHLMIYDDKYNKVKIGDRKNKRERGKKEFQQKTGICRTEGGVDVEQRRLKTRFRISITTRYSLLVHGREREHLLWGLAALQMKNFKNKAEEISTTKLLWLNLYFFFKCCRKQWKINCFLKRKHLQDLDRFKILSGMWPIRFR